MKKIIWICVIVILSGCVQQKPLEELGLITAMGYDNEDGMLKGSIIYYEFDPMHPNNTKMVTTLAHTSKGVRQKENLASSRRLVSGQLRVAIYGEELAKEGIISIIDTLSRDAQVGTMSYLAVSRPKAQELLQLSQDSEDISNAGTFLYELITQNVEGDTLLSPTLHEFMQCYYSEGRDPVLPLLNFKDNTIIIEGLSLFQDDKVVGELDSNDSFYLKLMVDPFDAGSTEITIPKEQLKKYILTSNNKQEDSVFVSLDHLRSVTDIKLEDKKVPSYSIEVNVKTRMQEISENYDLGNPEALKKLEEAIGKDMEGQLIEVLEKSREMGADPVGFGNYYRAKVGYDSFSTEEWRKQYQNSKYKISINVEILRTGVMD
ncbi:MAG: Ger(x)C family spore germination protein [Bacillota bacterium]|jgi:spore germination protein|uniref:Ger(x)C family spore germination protein n=1 Tax=Bacillus sp. RO2 TaxID=2723913 RepID=UPI00145F3E21|nr:Ger(x)C family spore germination protein [Bacillus sp. RO2]MEA3319152.1 Ger(x)C family spore germination protein [Bacillota bacterium]NMH72985.1 Ger(x)C family spore germination protein [Bacillus sp. RO2]